MEFSSLKIIVLLCVAAVLESAEGFNPKHSNTTKNSTTLQASTGKISELNATEVEDRMGLNYETASAYSNNQNSGSYSGHRSVSAAGGILNNRGSYNSLYDRAQAEGNSYAYGDNAPQTWANTFSRVRPGSASGYASSGYSGGRGDASSSDFSSYVEMPLGDGTTLLSNLRTNVTKSATKSPPVPHSHSDEHSNKSPKNKSDAIVFKDS